MEYALDSGAGEEVTAEKLIMLYSLQLVLQK